MSKVVEFSGISELTTYELKKYIVNKSISLDLLLDKKYIKRNGRDNNGIYFLIKKEEIIYIGQSQCILRRINEHLKNGKKFDSITIQYMPYSTKKDKRELEHKYIERLRPEENNIEWEISRGLASKQLVEYHTPNLLIEQVKVGRPALYESPNELAIKIKDYFEWCNNERENPTITGLTLFLGFSDKKSLRDYAEKKEFSPLIKKARTMVEHRYEKELLGHYYGGAIFALKNMGWTDKREIRHENMSRSIGVVKIMLEDNRKEVKAEIEDELQGKK